MKLFILSVFFVAVGISTHGQDAGKVVSKYDFVPGEKIVFYDEFAAENVGDFPAAWNTSGSGEIVTHTTFPGRWFQMTKGGYFIPEAKDQLTENFTIEFDFLPTLTTQSEAMYGMDIFLVSGSLDNPSEGGAIPGKAGLKITLGYDNVQWTNYSQKDEGYKDQGNSSFTFKVGQKYHVAFWIQKSRVRIYADENKILDLPRGLIAGYTYNIFRIETGDETVPMIARFRIATGLPDMRNKLLTQGKFISYGIQFDVNSDKLKPESYGTLKEIAVVLKENPTIRVKIVGHTDADGDDALNLDLSKRRAVSVKAELMSQFAIDNARLETDGKGETQPIAPNDNAINKAKNRRVEFIRL